MQSLQCRCARLAATGSKKKFAISNNRNCCFPGSQRLKSPRNLLRPFLPDVDANVRIQQEARLHLKALPFLRTVFFAFWNLEVLWHSSQQIECPSHVALAFTEHDFISTAEDFNFFAVQAKLLWQADRLAVTRSKYTCSVHKSTLVYTPGIYKVEIGTQVPWHSPNRQGP